jgi:glutamine synthetase
VAMGVTGEFPPEGPYYDVISPTDRDMHLRPDPTTVRIVPWATDPTAQVLHDCYDSDGQLIPFAPRSVLRKVIDLYSAKGWSPIVAPELEFYLVARNTDPDMPLKPPIGRSGRSETSRQAYSIDAVNEFDPLFEDVYDYCSKMELNVDTLIHEIGAGQMEINFFHDAPLGLADEVFFFKRTVREAALRHDMYATFMAKPIAGEPGSAMHVHQSVVNTITGKNIFSNEDGSPTQEFFWYIGGLQRYIPAAMALFAPYVNSYRRLARHTAAPINIQWGTDNRTVGIRSPIATPQARRIENRVIGADALTARWPPRWPAATWASRTRSRRRPNARATPTWATTRCRARSARRSSCCATRSTCTRCWARTSSPSTPKSRRSSTPSS